MEEQNVNQTQQNAAQETQINQSSTQYGGFWIRFVAYLLDSLIVGLPLGLITLFLTSLTQIGVFDYLSYILIAVYFIYFEGTTGQTLGKKIVGVKVVDENGKIIGIPNAILRYIGKILSAIILLIGYIMAGFHPQKQALHDIIAKTYVIKV